MSDLPPPAPVAPVPKTARLDPPPDVQAWLRRCTLATPGSPSSCPPLRREACFQVPL